MMPETTTITLKASRGRLMMLCDYTLNADCNATASALAQLVKEQLENADANFAARFRRAMLTPTQLNVLKTIHDYIEREGFAPTFQELGDELGVSKVSAFGMCNALQAKGVLSRNRNLARGLRIVDAKAVA